MKKINIKVKIILSIIFLISLSTYTLYCHFISNKESGTSPKICEIKNTSIVYNYPDSKVITIEKHYIITNPPKDLGELKKLIENFLKDTPLETGSKIDKNKKRQYESYFYRSSRKLPSNWQPSDGYFATDRIEDHKNDLIASVFGASSETSKMYSIINRSNKIFSYGKVIETLQYKDDQIISAEKTSEK
ncbi:hypothetical protein [Inconstantimicrobium mannanitabidum]|uniref:Uncharacterized protein n=1 Tax=Inconstantimicrobium mannanitabidum TaxID=1604901 RepID=A0ACB5RIR4_9CLOT|nr:hypothetical protein [Clostridium sp. TW13]GKX68964.1 hypothetical protein rsdtw13_42220 [Clostridium sp. TW13]